MRTETPCLGVLIAGMLATALGACSPRDAAYPGKQLCLSSAEYRRINVRFDRGSASNSELSKLLAHTIECEEGPPSAKRSQVTALITELQKRGEHRWDPMLEYGEYANDALGPSMLSGTDCPNLRSGDATATATAAYANGDCHLLMVGGFAGIVPGGESSRLPYRLIAGTGDDSDTTGLRAECAVPRPVAIQWAEQYNRTVVGLEQSQRGCGKRDARSP